MARMSATLTVQFTFSMGVSRGQEGAPLVVNNTMYIVAPYPNELFALDLTQPGAPLKWSYKPQPMAAAQGVACCDVVNRGAFFYEGAPLLRNWTAMRSPSMRQAARKSGRSASATSTKAKPSPWRRR